MQIYGNCCANSFEMKITFFGIDFYFILSYSFSQYEIKSNFTFTSVLCRHISIWRLLTKLAKMMNIFFYSLLNGILYKIKIGRNRYIHFSTANLGLFFIVLIQVNVHNPWSWIHRNWVKNRQKKNVLNISFTIKYFGNKSSLS